MCGILTYYKPSGISKEDVEQSVDSLDIIRHRGPDSEGLVLINTRTGHYARVRTKDTPADIEAEDYNTILEKGPYDLLLGHRRLSILDLSSKGHQPFYFDGLLLIFNGEVYNFIEIRQELKVKGYRFETETDTEVIAAAYREWGPACFPRFNGMWSLVMYDLRSGEFIMSNDRYGVKPLYYTMYEGGFMMFSEPKQARAYAVKKHINNYLVDVFMDTGYLIFNNQTFFKEINRFPVSSFYKFKASEPVSFEEGPQKYYTLSSSVKKPLNDKEAIETFRHILSDAVKLRLRSDVQLGVSLSGGLDSTSIAFLAKEVLNHDNFVTYSVISEKGSAEDESYFINLANDKLQSHNIQVNPLYDFNESSFLKHIYQMGSPVNDTSFFAQYSLKKAIKGNNTIVLLSGQGGDEILSGYHHHFIKYAAQLFIQGKLSTFRHEIAQWSEMKERNPKDVYNIVMKDVYLTYKTRLGLARFPYEMQKKVFSANKMSEYMRQDIDMLQLPYFLQADDRFSMSYSIETRNPFLDYRLVDFAFSLPDSYKIRDGWQKWLLREAVPEMPHEIRYRTDKKGFTTPMSTWVEQQRPMLESFAAICDSHFPQHKTKPLFKRASMGAWIKNFLLN